MKRVLLFLFVSVLLIGCSKDDAPAPAKTPAELLVNHGPWVFDRGEIIQITSNWNNTPPEEILQAINTAMAGTKFTFLANGTLKFSQDGYSGETTWEFPEISAGNFDYTRIMYGDQFEYFEGVKITATSFSYEIEDCTPAYDCAKFRYHFR